MNQEPEAIKTATEKILKKLENFRNALDKIDQTVVEQWVRDLVVVTTFVGLRFQEAVLRKGAEMKRTTYRLSTDEEESSGIDGFIGSVPVSIKPDTYKGEQDLKDQIPVKLIYYKKLDDEIEIDFSEL